MIMLNSIVIKEFFMQEIVALVEKYNQLDDVMVKKIELILQCINSKGVRQLSIDDLIEMAEKISDENTNEDFIQFYYSYCENIEYLDIEDAEELWSELSSSGFIKNSDVIIYTHSKFLREYTEERITDILQDSDEVDRLFDKETLVDYFTEEVPKDRIERELLNTVDPEEILGIEVEALFISSEGTSYRYAIVD